MVSVHFLLWSVKFLSLLLDRADMKSEALFKHVKKELAKTILCKVCLHFDSVVDVMGRVKGTDMQ